MEFEQITAIRFINNLENEMCIKAGELARGDDNEEIYTNLNRLQQFTLFIL